MAVDVRAELAALLGEAPVPAALEPAAAVAGPVAPGPWKVTARMSGGMVQISNNLQSRVVRKEEVETYLRRSMGRELGGLL
jgi:hypothetical protein